MSEYQENVKIIVHKSYPKLMFRNPIEHLQNHIKDCEDDETIKLLCLSEEIMEKMPYNFWRLFQRELLKIIGERHVWINKTSVNEIEWMRYRASDMISKLNELIDMFVKTYNDPEIEKYVDVVSTVNQ